MVKIYLMLLFFLICFTVEEPLIGMHGVPGGTGGLKREFKESSNNKDSVPIRAKQDNYSPPEKKGNHNHYNTERPYNDGPVPPVVNKNNDVI